MVSKGHGNHVNSLITLISPNCEHSPVYPALPGNAAEVGWDQMAGVGGVRVCCHIKCALSPMSRKGFVSGEVLIVEVLKDWDLDGFLGGPAAQ